MRGVALLSAFRSRSCDSLPLHQAEGSGGALALAEGLPTDGSAELDSSAPLYGHSHGAFDIEMQSLGMAPSPNATCEDIHRLPASIEEWRMALQTALKERQSLAMLLRKYQTLVQKYRDCDYKRFFVAMEQSFRRRAGTVATAKWTEGTSVGVETDNHHHHEDCGRAEGPSQEEDECLQWQRRPSDSSSFLYAGVEIHVPPARPPTRTFRTLLDASVEAVAAADPPSVTGGTYTLVEALVRLSKGGWLYKYPRRQFAKLISQKMIPTTHLSWRYFWFNAHRGLLLWSTDPSSAECKAVQVLDYYTEKRLLREEERDVVVTVAIVLTGEENALALVPSTNEDLDLWLKALAAFTTLRRDARWPENIAICSIESPE